MATPSNNQTETTPTGEAVASVLKEIADETEAFTLVPEHGFSLFLAKRTKTIHFVRHAEGQHNQANRAAGNDSPVTFSTKGAWDYQDAKLTAAGIAQCTAVRQTQCRDVHPQVIIVSPFTRTLQTAHVMFSGRQVPFIVHDLCAERSGKFTCDKRRTKTEIVAEIKPLYDYTTDEIDFTSFGYPTENDERWTETREADKDIEQRTVAFMQWLASRPEQEIAVVTHSSWLKHLFRQFGHTTAVRDKETLHRLAGNAELRSVSLACHCGFYPDGQWTADGQFVPEHPSFRRGRWAPSMGSVSEMHKGLLANTK